MLETTRVEEKSVDAEGAMVAQRMRAVRVFGSDVVAQVFQMLLFEGCSERTKTRTTVNRNAGSADQGVGCERERDTGEHGKKSTA